MELPMPRTTPKISRPEMRGHSKSGIAPVKLLHSVDSLLARVQRARLGLKQHCLRRVIFCYLAEFEGYSTSRYVSANDSGGG